MSEINDMNFGGGSAADLERTLRELSPQVVEANRDELFFRAGLAAGARTRGAALVWPAAVAALLMVCVGLSASLVQRQHTPSAIGRDSVENMPATAHEAVVFASDNGSRNWQRLASPAPSLPPGKLTAMGWIDSPSAPGIEHQELERKPNSSPPRQPPTYFELLRAYQEG